MDRYPWPESFASPHISKETCHALGLLVVAWNWCERIHKFLTGVYLRHPYAEVVVANLPSNTRAGILADLVAATEKRDDLREAIEHYQACYAICLENRNTLVHGLGAPIDFDRANPASFASMAKRLGHSHRFYPADPMTVLRVSQECDHLFIYGSALFRVVEGRQQPLPRKLPKPRKLTEVPPIQTGESPPPGSSRGKSKPQKK